MQDSSDASPSAPAAKRATAKKSGSPKTSAATPKARPAVSRAAAVPKLAGDSPKSVTRAPAKRAAAPRNEAPRATVPLPKSDQIPPQWGKVANWPAAAPNPAPTPQTWQPTAWAGPALQPPTAMPMTGGWSPVPFSANSKLVLWLMAAVAAQIALSGVIAFAWPNSIGNSFEDPWQGVVVSLGGAVSLAAQILGLVWVWRVCSNLRALGLTGLKHSTGWAIGCWFIPVANLILPFFPMQEAWRRSDAGPQGPLVAWWIAWALSGLTGMIYGGWTVVFVFSEAFRSGSRGQSFDSADVELPMGLAWIRMAQVGILLIAGGLFMLVLRTLTEAQDRAAARANLVATPS